MYTAGSPLLSIIHIPDKNTMLSSMALNILLLLTVSVLEFPLPAGGLGAEAAAGIAKGSTIAQVGSAAKDPNVPDAIACKCKQLIHLLFVYEADFSSVQKAPS